MYNIPLFTLNYDNREEEAVAAVLRSKWISAGEQCKNLENTFAAMLGCSHAVSVTNCTAALHMAMLALGIGAGDEVIVPSLTFVATANAVRYAGATPVFCDISGDGDFSVSPHEIEASITAKTKAVIVMHYAGFPCAMAEIMDIARRHNLFVIEDACHGPLSEYRGQKLGTIGDIGCFSFFSNKNISTAEGGILVTNSAELFDKLRLMRSHGMTSVSYDRATGHSSSYDVVLLGYNYRFDDIRASLALVQLKKLEADFKRRVEIREQYIDELKGVNFVKVPYLKNTEYVSNYILPVMVESAQGVKTRDALREHLTSCGIQTSIHYPPAHRFSIYEPFYKELPKTDYIAEREVTLPMYAGLTCDEISYICKKIKEFE